MDQIYLLEEVITHGTPQLPCSIHRTHVRSESINILYLHWHQEFEFLLITEGNAIFHIGDKDYIVNENEGLFIPPNTLHSATSLDGMPCTFYALVFHVAFLTDNSKGSIYTKYVKPLLTGNVVFTKHFTCNEPWQQKAITLLGDIVSYYDANLDDLELWLKSKIFELWHLFFIHLELLPKKNTKRSLAYDRLEGIFNFIHSHYAETISLKALADMVSISESQFSRSFKKEIGMSPFEYIIQYRILRSCALLSHTDEKISVIANQVGFNNISYFNKEFKGIVGCAPSEYRKHRSSCTMLSDDIQSIAQKRGHFFNYSL